MKLKQDIQQLREALKTLQQTQNKTNNSSLTDFKSQQTNALKTTVENALSSVEKELSIAGITKEQISLFNS